MRRYLSFLLLLLGSGCADEAKPDRVLSSAGPYWAPIDDFFDGAVGWEAISERADQPVRMRVLSPLPFLDPEGYDLPLLEMAPPAEVRVAPPPGSGPLRFEAFTGAVVRVGEEVACSVRFEVLVDGQSVVSTERRWSPDLTTSERQWGALPPVDVADGAEIVLRTTLVEGPDEPLAVGFGRPRIMRAQERPAPIAGTPNIVFVLMDTLRRDKLSVYGGDDDWTPQLERLADRGTVFEDAYATSSWTWPSTASVLTGLLPEEHGITSHDESYLHGRVRTLPELLREAGYVTGGFSTNPLIDVCHNYDQGFDSFDDPTWLFDPTNTVADGVLRWLNDHADQRFFLYLHLVDPHVPYEPLPQFAMGAKNPKVVRDRPRLPMELRDRLIEGMAESAEDGSEYRPGKHINVNIVRSLEGQYERCVQSADYWIGKFLKELDDLDLLDETVFVFTSDHGEEFLDHGLLAHANSLHRELTNVPLIVAGPGWSSDERVDHPVSNRHLAPTLLRLAGGDPAQLGRSDRVDLRQIATLPDQPAFFSTTTGVWRGRKGTSVFGMRASDWLVHVWETPDESGQGWETRLFDLGDDPEALVDLGAEDPVRTATMQEIVLERLSQSREYFEAEGDIEAVGAGEAGMQLLRSIGYIGDDE